MDLRAKFLESTCIRLEEEEEEKKKKKKKNAHNVTKLVLES